MSEENALDDKKALRFQELLHLDRKIFQLEDQLKSLKEERVGLEEEVKTLLTSMRSSKVGLKTGETIHLRRQLFANKRGDCDTQHLCEQLQIAGLHEFVKEGYHAAQLSAYIREKEEEFGEQLTDGFDRLLPEPLRGLVNVYEKISVNVLGARTKT